MIASPSSPFGPGAGLPGASDRWTGRARDRVRVAPTPRSAVMTDGPAQLLRFVRPEGRADGAPGARPLLVVPSLIGRWYILDLRPGASVIERLTGAGIDTFCLDWGVAGDEDRHLSWDDVVARIGRAARRVLRITGAPALGLLGYSVGGTLSSIYASLDPDRVEALVNVAGPIDFSKAGTLGDFVDPRWFDAAAVARAGNLHPMQMQAGFEIARPTRTIRQALSIAARAGDPDTYAAYEALETWSRDNVPFPGAAYGTYIRELYQQNALVRGEHRVRGRRADLSRVRCPVMAIVASRDKICPPPAATALVDASGSRDAEVLEATGGHVGAIVGRRAPRELYPAATAWLRARLRVPSE